MEKELIQVRDELLKFVVISPEGNTIIALAFAAARQVFQHNVARMIRDKKGAPPGIREVIDELRDKLRSNERFAPLAKLDDQAFYAEVAEAIVDRQLKLATGAMD